MNKSLKEVTSDHNLNKIKEYFYKKDYYLMIFHFLKEYYTIYLKSMNLIQLNNIILNIIYIYTEKYLNIKINSNKILYSIKSCINELSEKHKDILSMELREHVPYSQYGQSHQYNY